MHSGLTNRLIPLVKSFPRFSGTLFATAGCYAFFTGIRKGTLLEPFRGGAEIQGRVEAVVDTSNWRPRYSADIVAEVAGREPVVLRVPISQKEATVLRNGAPIPLVQARDGSANFIRASHLKAASPVDIAGRTVTFEAFLGLIFLCFGLWLFLAGPRRFRSPSPVPAQHNPRPRGTPPAQRARP